MTAMLIAIIRPAAIFGGLHFGWVLGIYISSFLIFGVITLVEWYSYFGSFIPSICAGEDLFELLWGIFTLVAYLAAMILMVICLSTLQTRIIYR